MQRVESNVRAALFVCLCLTALPSRANECDDAFTECKDTCLIQYGGSVRPEMKKKYEKCAAKCGKTGRHCTEQLMETRNNGLDDGSLARTRGDDDLREEVPARSSGRTRAAPREEEDERPRREEPVKKKEALREDEVPTSDRTQLKVDEEEEKAERERAREREREREKEREKKKEEEPKAEAIEMRLKPQKEENDLRDDQPRKEEPPKREERKRREVREAPPPKKEEDHDDLRYY